METNMKIIESNDDIIKIELSHGIQVTFKLGEENVDGEMEVEFDENILTSDDASKIVNEYFSVLLELMQQYDDKFNEPKSITEEK